MTRSAEQIFHEAREMPASDQAAYLKGACGGDAGLRAKVAALLKADAEAGSFLRTSEEASPATARTIAAAPHEHEGQMIGRYKLLQPIGEGGFGSVWMAEQREPVKRRVALKIIKLGMDTRQVIARFEAERQALATMDHPNIAKVLDAGATETGRPYFVMEYIKGVPILEYCDTDKLDTKARLGLFGSVCHAIQHAHTKGIIHRDIKPSNVLVTMHDGVPVPKVIDFGIAKATSSELTARTLFTEHRQMIGTPAYMSPEQAEMSGLDIDTRSDIYSLGVLLYELLTGTTPFDSKSLMEAGFAEMMRIIREVEPHKPSTRLSSLGDTGSRTAQQRHVGDIKKLGLILRGDLDWIVMKCLEKDRTRRYETANGLAADIKRHLNDETVTAGAPSSGYKLRKFVKRNRAQVIAGGVVAGALVLGVVGTTTGMVWALHEKSKATLAAESETKARKRAETISEFVTTALRAGDAQNSGREEGTAGAGQDMTILAAMDNAIKDIDSGRFKDDPETEAALRETIGVILRNNGNYDKAKPLLEQALAMRERLFKGDDPIVARSLDNLALLYQDQGQYAQAEPLFTRALAIYEKARGPDHADVADILNNLAALYHDQGRYAQAEPLYTRALAISEKALGPDHPDVAVSLGNLAQVYHDQGQYGEAEPLYKRALAIDEKALGPDHASVAWSLNILASLYQDQGRYGEAEPLYKRALAIREKALGPDHPLVASSLNDLAGLYCDQGQYAQAEQLHTRALAIREKALGPDHHLVATSLINLAHLYYDQGRFAQAEPLNTRGLAIREKTLGPDHPDVLKAKHNLAALYWSQGKFDKSVPLYEEVLKAQEAKLGRQNPSTLMTVGNLGVNYKDADRLSDAIPLLEEAYRASKRYPQLGFVGPQLFDAYTRAADPAKPESTARVVALMQELLADARATLPKDSPELAVRLATFGVRLVTLKAWDEAEPLIREALTIREKAQPDAWTTFNTKSLLGAVLQGQKNLAEAEGLLLDGYRGMKEREAAIPAQAKVRIPETLERLVRLYEAKGNEPEAAAWRSKLEAARAEQAKPDAKGGAG
jgi:eukaryotic-like serine/threonine-protein kinase